MIIWWATIINFWESSQGYTYLMGYYYLIGKSSRIKKSICKSTFSPSCEEFWVGIELVDLKPYNYLEISFYYYWNKEISEIIWYSNRMVNALEI